jgi:hypothetical protein
MAEGDGEWQIPSWLIVVVSLLLSAGALYILLGAGVLAVTPHLLVAAVGWAVIWRVASRLKNQPP